MLLCVCIRVRIFVVVHFGYCCISGFRVVVVRPFQLPFTGLHRPARRVVGVVVSGLLSDFTGSRRPVRVGGM